MTGYDRDMVDDLFVARGWASLMGGSAGPALMWPSHPAFPEAVAEGFLGLSYGMYEGQRALRTILNNLDWVGLDLPGSWAQESIRTPSFATDLPPRSQTLADEYPGIAAINHQAVMSPDGNTLVAFLLVDHIANEDDLKRDAMSTAYFPVPVTFSNLNEATLYTVTWFDVRRGTILKTQTGTGPSFEIPAPEFKTFVIAMVQAQEVP